MTLKTALYNLHQELNGKLVDFAGYSLPIQYSQGLLKEHHHTRNSASLFDVSHMGQIKISGKNLVKKLEKILPIDLENLQLNNQKYSLLLNNNGGIIDDLMIIKHDNYFSLILNGACKKNDINWIRQNTDLTLEVLDDFSLLALQGPKSENILSGLFSEVKNLIFMQGLEVSFEGEKIYITRSGYSGEDGFEISVPNSKAERLARDLLSKEEVKPSGIGARNSLRLEAGLCLMGSDMNDQITPAEANLNWSIPKIRRTIGDKSGGFLGSAKVLAQFDKKAPIIKTRVGLKAKARIPVRDGTELVLEDNKAIGKVTSGLLSPTLDIPIAMAYIDVNYASLGQEIYALVRNQKVLMEIVKMPFIETKYKR